MKKVLAIGLAVLTSLCFSIVPLGGSLSCSAAVPEGEKAVLELTNGTAWNFGLGFGNGWDKRKPDMDMKLDETEKAIKINAKTGIGSELEFKPAEAFPIGESKNRYLVLRVKGDANLSRLVAYFLTTDTTDGYGPKRVRVLTNQTISEDAYTNIVFDLYDKGAAGGGDWTGELRQMRFDLLDKDGRYPAGTMYIKYIAIFDTAEAAEAFDGDFGGTTPSSSAAPKPSTESSVSTASTESTAAGQTETTSSKAEQSQQSVLKLSNGIAYNLGMGLDNGWKKHQDEYVMTVDEKEKALKIDASSGSKLEFEPTETFSIGENKNRYMVLRIKGDPDMSRVVVYFTLMSQAVDHPYGSTVRLIENQVINEETYTDIIFDLYEKGKGYGNDWNGELRRLRLDLNNAQGKDPSGTLYVKHIGFFDTLDAAKAFDGDFGGDTPNTPDTGIDTPVWLVLIACISSACFLVVAFERKSRKEKRDFDAQA